MSTVLARHDAWPSLADELEAVLDAALAGSDGVCVWCGSACTASRVLDRWAGAVEVTCAACGSQLSGAVARRREARP